MTSTSPNSLSSDPIAALTHWAYTAVPAGSDNFDRLAIFSLLCYLVFAVVALQYALRSWAEKVMLTAMAAGTIASLVLHFSLRHHPSYQGEGPLWKFVSLSQYLPWAVISVGGLYLIYRTCTALRKSRS